VRLTHRAVRLVLCMVTGLALALVGVVPASAATAAKAAPATGTASSWTLLDVQQRMCLTASGGHPNTYFVAPIYGAWSTTITTGIRNLPPGSSSSGGTTLPPGENYSPVVNGFVQVSIAPAPAGLYTAEVWASDGVETQAVPVRIYMLEYNLVGCPAS
jgi:hypothetical protein